jgi:hypothetical protein
MRERERGLSRRFIFRNIRKMKKIFRDGPLDEQKNSVDRRTTSEK